MFADGERDLCSSVASRRAIIKNGCGRPDLQTDARLSSRSLPNRGYTELPVSAAHVRAVGSLPARHPGPFDRPQVKQPRVEDLALARSDARLGS
jgi:PIN domain nuclease of toxin-antitoxin system